MTEPEAKNTGSFRDWFVAPSISAEEANVLTQQVSPSSSFFDWVPPPIVRFFVWTEGFWHLYLSMLAVMILGFCLKGCGLQPELLLTNASVTIWLFAPPWILYISLIFLNRWFKSRCVFIVIAWFFCFVLFWEGNGFTQGAITASYLRAWRVHTGS